MIEHLYIHIPFCKRRCFYCDFNSSDQKDFLVDDYFKALNKELDEFDFEELSTIYIGGGTPSFVSERYICELLARLPKAKETTIEVNPCTVNSDKIRAYMSAGINRISIGLQTTNDDILKTIGRAHDFKQFINAFEIIKSEGYDNINVDLMFGLPKQTLDDVKESIDYLIEAQPQHISCYSLILHENIFKDLPSDDDERKMYYYVIQALKDAGYGHYEISNFSKNGYESQHNLAYWNQEEYVGLGAGASSYLGKTRYTNELSIEKYIDGIQSGTDIRKIEEVQNDEDRLREYMILQLRLINGLNIKKTNERFKLDILEVFKNQLKKLKELELIDIEDNKILLTKKGLDFANIVWREFV